MRPGDELSVSGVMLLAALLSAWSASLYTTHGIAEVRVTWAPLPGPDAGAGLDKVA